MKTMFQYLQYLYRKYGIGLFVSIGFFLLSALMGVFLLRPIQQQQALLQSEVIQQARKPGIPLPTLKNMPALSMESSFYQALPPYSDLENKLGSIFTAAKQQEVWLDQVSYKMEPLPKTHFSRYRITLPVSGGYLKIRQFLNQIMKEIPTLSLDQISFSRETATDTEIQANLELSLYTVADHL